MTKMILLATTAVAFGLAGLVLLAMGWIQRRKPDLITLGMLVLAIWLQTLKITAYNYAWQTNASLHPWPQLFSNSVDRATIILIGLGGLHHAWINRKTGNSRRFFRITLVLSILILAITVANLILSRVIWPACAFAAGSLILWTNLLWLETQILITAFRRNARVNRDGTLIHYRTAAVGLTLGLATALFFHLANISPSFLIIILSLLISLTVFVCYGIHSTKADSPAPLTGENENRAEIASAFGLTARETEIVSLIIEGKSNNEIAEKLFISLKTVESHLYNIFRKMKVSSRLQIVSLILGPKS